jgi:DNA-binding beta-propeller fold protein YncE
VSVRLRGLEVVLLLARIPLRRVALWAMVICLLSSSGGRAQSPGKESSGRVLLPNGWYLSPAGQEVALGGFPLRVVAVPRSPYAIVTSNGYGQHFLAVLNIKTRTVENKAPIHEGWMGLAVSSDGSTVYASAGGEDRILTFRFRQGALTPPSSIPRTCATRQSRSMSKLARSSSTRPWAESRTCARSTGRWTGCTLPTGARIASVS